MSEKRNPFDVFSPEAMGIDPKVFAGQVLGQLITHSELRGMLRLRLAAQKLERKCPRRMLFVRAFVAGLSDELVIRLGQAIRERMAVRMLTTIDTKPAEYREVEAFLEWDRKGRPAP